MTYFVTVTLAATIQVDTDDALPVWACVCVCLTTRVSAGHVIKQIGCCWIRPPAPQGRKTKSGNTTVPEPLSLSLFPFLIRSMDIRPGDAQNTVRWTAAALSDIYVTFSCNSQRLLSTTLTTQLLKKFLALHRNGRAVTVFIHKWSLFSAR